MSDRTTSQKRGSDEGRSNLVNYSVNTFVEDRAFDPNRLLGCLSNRPTSNESIEEAERWYASERIVEPDGFMQLIVEKHGEDENFHYHLWIELEIQTFPDRPTETLQSWNGVVECLAQTCPTELQCSLITRAVFNKERWRAVLSLPRTASGLVPEMGDDEVLLSGVELNFGKTDLPLDELFMSAGNGGYYVAVRYQRTLRPQEISGLELLKEAEELAETFVIGRVIGDSEAAPKS